MEGLRLRSRGTVSLSEGALGEGASEEDLYGVGAKGKPHKPFKHYISRRMHTIEVYLRNPEEIHNLTSFLEKNHYVFTNKGIVLLDEATFNANYTSLDPITPSRDFATLCGRENLTRDGKIRAKDIFLFLSNQLKNPNCFFLEQLMKTEEYLAAVPTKGL